MEQGIAPHRAAQDRVLEIGRWRFHAAERIAASPHRDRMLRRRADTARRGAVRRAGQVDEHTSLAAARLVGELTGLNGLHHFHVRARARTHTHMHMAATQMRCTHQG